MGLNFNIQRKKKKKVSGVFLPFAKRSLSWPSVVPPVLAHLPPETASPLTFAPFSLSHLVNPQVPTQRRPKQGSSLPAYCQGPWSHYPFLYPHLPRFIHVNHVHFSRLHEDGKIMNWRWGGSDLTQGKKKKEEKKKRRKKKEKEKKEKNPPPLRQP